MPSKNTRHVRHSGYSDLKQAARKAKNYGVRTGRTVDSSGERAKSGKKPYNPPRTNDSHWA